MSAKRPTSCFVCGKKSPSIVQPIEGCIVPGTFRPIKEILKHFEKLVQHNLDVTPMSKACRDCLEYLFNYDRLVRNLSQLRRKIANSLINCRKNPTKTIKDPIPTTTRQSEQQDTTDEEDEVMPVEEGTIELPTTSKTPKDTRKVQCRICEEVFQNREIFNKHMEDKHTYNKQGGVTCHICGLRLKDNDVLDLHMNLHEGKTELECRYCPKKYSHKRNVLRHMEVHWDKKKFQCEKCGECFSLSWLLYDHKMRHDAEENALICDVCHQQFKTKRTYNHHLLTHQVNRPRYHCTDCSKSFMDKYTLKVHKRTHNPTDAKSDESPAESKSVAETSSTFN